MTDREEREEHIKRLEAALACEEKQFLGKCSKQTCDDNCALLYEQGNWGEWKETLRYAINSLKTDLKYDLLYEETSGQADKPTTKNDLAVDKEQLKTMIRGLTKWYVKRDNTEVGEPNTAVGLLYDDVMFGIDKLPSVTPQEPILDQITEIIEPLRHLPIGEMSDIEWDILRVIDKYKGETEEHMNCEDCNYIDIADWEQDEKTGKAKPVYWCERFKKLCSSISKCQYKVESEKA